jgi:hypothetical protein
MKLAIEKIQNNTYDIILVYTRNRQFKNNKYHIENQIQVFCTTDVTTMDVSNVKIWNGWLHFSNQ